MTKIEQMHDRTWAEFLSQNSSVLVCFLVVCILVISVYVLDRRWRGLQRELERVTGMMNQSHAYSLNLVRHFMPSFKVERYQFRGMQIKAGTVSVSFKDLGLDLPNGKRVLNGVTGRFEAARMCAIMGPSGAGKTTFMNVLCGKATYGKMTGSMHINGKETDPKDIKNFMGFVPQDDIVHQDLTVREQIQFSARMRGDVAISQNRVKRITEDVLNVMQIDHIQNSIVGGVEKRGISGGQRKRVNIGLELAAEPTLLFLDEPTSGLDSTSSLAVCLSLKKMCQLGMTSIMVIHQPRYSLFTLFDDVLLLGKGGETVYLGPSLGAKSYFEGLGFTMPLNDNPADWFMDVLSGEVANSRIENFKPEMLSNIWRERGVSDLEGQHGDDEYVSGSRRGRNVTAEEDVAVLQKKLEEQWDSVDVNRDGVMEPSELQELLALCSSMVPDPEVVRELMDRMGGPGCKVVTRKQFLEFLVSLSGDVANDETLKELDKKGITGLTRRGRWLKRARKATGNSGSIIGSQNDDESGADDDSSESSGVPNMNMKKKPGFHQQMNILTLRRLVQWWRMNEQRAIFLTALTLGGVVLAVLDRWIVNGPRWDAMALLNLHTALALLLAIFCLQTFGNDQPVFWRESSSGLNIFAYFLAKASVNFLDIVVQTFLFTTVYYLLRQPYVPFWEFVIPFGFTAYAASGWGYLVSTLVPPQHGPFIVSLVVFIICGLLGNPSTLTNFLTGGVMDFCVSSISITRWSVQMSFVIARDYLKPTPANFKDKAMLDMFNGVFYKDGNGIQHIERASLALFGMGIGTRFLSYLGLRFRNRDKMV